MSGVDFQIKQKVSLDSLRFVVTVKFCKQSFSEKAVHRFFIHSNNRM